MARQVLREINPADISATKIAMLGATTVNALVANVSSVQIFNPSGSGNNLIVYRIRIRSTAFNFGRTTTQLTTLTTDKINKFAFGPTPVAEIRTDQTGSPPTVTDPFEIRAPAADGEVEVISTQFPIILSPNQGFTAFTSATDDLIDGLFEWVEILR